MKLPPIRTVKFGLLAILMGLGLVGAVYFWNSSNSIKTQRAQMNSEKKEQAETPRSPPQPASTNVPAPAVETNSAPPRPEPSSPSPAAAQVPTPPAQPPAPPPKDAPAPAEREKGVGSDEIQLSFQGANIDLVVQWLAKTTGKSVVKHPKVQCQMTIVSSKKLSLRDAINLVYRALALEGFAAVETSQSILIVPEGQEPKLRPELIDDSHPELPEGRQLLMRIFPLKHVQASELRDKLRSALSDKATLEIADRANQLIVTDYTDNIRLLGELIKELDVPSGGDIVIEFYTLKHSEAEELGSLLSLILNSQPAPPSSPGRSSSPPPSRGGPSPSIGGTPSPSSSPEPSSSGPPPAGGGAAGAAPQVRIWSDKTANRLIVAAPKSKLPEVEKLIALLDTEKPQDVSIRVLPLKHVSAEDLVKEIGPLFQRMSGKSLKETIEVTANTRANAMVVLSSQSNYAAILKLISALDTEEAQEKAMRAFPLQNADAEDVAKQLQELNQEQSGTSRYPFYIFSSSYYGGKSPRKATFVADRRRNTVIAQATPAEMDSLAKMILELDKPVTDDSLAPKIFRLKYVSATDIETVLNELFLKKQQQRSYWDDYYFSGYEDSRERQGAGRLYGKIRITSEPYANAIIVTANSLENLAAVEEVIGQLDVPSQAAETTLRVNLKWAKAATVANSLNVLFATGGSPPLRPVVQPGQPGVQTQQQQQQPGSSAQSSFELGQEAREEGYFPWLGGQPESYRSLDGRNTVRQVSDLVGRVRVVPDHRSNSLLVSANVHLLTQVTKLIEDLDVPTAQVLLEAKILEVSSDLMDRLGVRWSPDGSQTFTADDFDNSIMPQVDLQYIEEFGGPSAAIANSLHSGVLDTTLSLDFLIQFLRKTTDARVLAEPQLNVADNEVGKLFVGSQIPFIQNSQNTDVGTLNQSFSYKDVGIILEVTPHINTTGDVALRIRVEASAIVPGVTLFGGAIVDTRNFRTDLTAKHGQTLVLGGIIQKQISDTVRKVPFLGDIPVLGWLFKKKDKSTREVELMVFLRPTVVRTPEEAQQLLEQIDQKAPLIKEWKEDSRPELEQPNSPSNGGPATSTTPSSAPAQAEQSSNFQR